MVFSVWFSRSGLGRRLTSYARSALIRGMFYFLSFPLFPVTNQSNGGFLKAQGRRSSSSLDKRPAHTDFPRRLSCSRFLCHVGLPCTEQKKSTKKHDECNVRFSSPCPHDFTVHYVSLNFDIILDILDILDILMS